MTSKIKLKQAKFIYRKTVWNKLKIKGKLWIFWMVRNSFDEQR